MSWFAENWIWLLFGVAFIAMHFSGHGCHGGHGSHDGHHKGATQAPSDAGRPPVSSGTSGSHHQ
jgi:hypothetical protein